MNEHPQIGPETSGKLLRLHLDDAVGGRRLEPTPDGNGLGLVLAIAVFIALAAGLMFI